MLTSVRSLLAATTLAGAVCLSGTAMAQVVNPAEEVEDGSSSGIEISANVALVSDYRFRGVSLSDGEFAIQGGIDLSLPAGIYVGAWASSLDEDTVGYGSTELDIYAGWGAEFGNISTDIGVIAYLYPNAGDGLDLTPEEDQFDYFEAYASGSFALGPAEATLGVAYAPEQDSLGGDDNLYLYTDLGVGIPGTPVTVSLHLGFTDGFLTFTEDGEALDYSVGLEAAIAGPVSIGVAYVGVEGDGLLDPDGTFTDDGVVITLSASF
ncbi:MAG: TorF family putative porin [Alteraurantiacibacter sp.]